jgi:hypothetical protein
MPQYSLPVSVCSSPEEAIARGFVYRRPEYIEATIEQVVVVEQGTEEGNPTVDLIFKGDNDQKFAVLISARLLSSIPHVGSR